LKWRNFYDEDWVHSLKAEKPIELLPARKLPTVRGVEKDVLPVVLNFPLNSTEYTYTYVIHMDANRLFTFLLKNMKTDSGHRFRIIDSSGIIMLSENASENFSKIQEIPGMPHEKLNITREAGAYSFQPIGTNTLVTFVPSQKYNWVYVSEADYERISHNMTRPLKIILLISLVSILLSIIAAFIFSSKLYRPLQEMVKLLKPDEECQNEDEYSVILSCVNQYMDENEKLKGELEQHLPSSKELFLYHLVANRMYTDDEVEEKLRLFKVPKPQDPFVLVMDLDEADAFMENFALKDRMLLDFAMRNITQELIDTLGCGFMIDLEFHRYAIIFWFPDSISDEKAMQMVRKLAIEITDAIQTYLRFTLSVGIGSRSSGLAGMFRSYREAVAALDSHAFRRSEVFVFDRAIHIHVELEYPDHLEKKLFKQIAAQESDAAIETLQTMYNLFEDNNTLAYQSQLHLFSFRLLHAYANQMQLLKMNESEIYFDGHDFASLSMLLSKNRAVDHLNIFSRLSRAMCELIGQRRMQQNPEQVEQITLFIQQYYNQPLSLDMISEHVGLHRNYISTLFKQHIHMSIVDFINKVRIEKALELLQETDLKVMEIAEKVGFNNTHYFIRIFKQLVNMTPGQYKEKRSDKKEES